MNKYRNRGELNEISRRVFYRYMLSLLGVLLVLTGGYVLAEFVCAGVTWYGDSYLYWMLKSIQALAPFIMLLVMLGFSILFTRRAIRRAVGYLNEVVDAAKSLSAPAERPIELPPELVNVQNELNLAREQSLRNARAAREAEQRKNDLVVYLAHDLKTPLTSVIGYLTLLQEEPQISERMRARYTGVALEKAERLEELINEFFEITRFNLTTMNLELERTSLSRMLEQIAYEFQPIMAEKGLSWELAIQPQVELLCDPDKLERVFDNLIRNGVNYSYPGSRLLLTMKQTGDEVMISLKNHGKTISGDKLERIFEQFFRLDSARQSATGGSGLGLALAKEIVEGHGGRIEAQSAVETIEFTLWLPTGLSKQEG